METLGSNSVFGTTALEHIDALYGYALALTRNKAEAEDLVQETYLRAVKAANQPAPEGNLKAWLFVIMRNTWLNIARHNQNGRRVFEFDTDEQPLGVANDSTSNPHVVYLRKLEREQVRAAIEKLPDAYREIVVLRDLEGFSYHEIATVLNCPAGTVMSRLGRAREKLREALSVKQKVHRLHG
jgi:RNA polymerase sigma-70 factor (ECF subfamily)